MKIEDAKRCSVAVDFDGTLFEHHANWPDVGPIIPGCVEWLTRINHEFPVDWILWTVRSNFDGASYLDDAIDKIEEHFPSLDWHGINRRPTQHEWSSSPKAYATYYVDDAAIGCPVIIPEGRRQYVDWDRMGPYLRVAVKTHYIKQGVTFR